MLNSIFAPISKLQNKNRAAQKRKVRPALEVLEARELMAADALDVSVAAENSLADRSPEVIVAESAQADSVAIQGAAGYQIQMRFRDNTLTSTQKQIILNSAKRWQRVITAGLPDVKTDIGVIDDLLIDIYGYNGESGGTLASAGPRKLRSSSKLPYYGVMKFDLKDIGRLQQKGELGDVAAHEMGHVIGMGTVWDDLGLVRGEGTSNPYFVGKNASSVYTQWFGLSKLTGVPVENSGGAGSRDSHWRESLFDNELMTSQHDRNSALSALTVAALKDMGYSVNFSAAESYSPRTQRIGTPILFGPGGTITDTTPTFRWSAAKNATWYDLYVRNNKSGRVFRKWVQGATSYTHGSAFAEGSYTFWVRGWNNGKYGNWSKPMQFKIEIAKPGTPTLIGPSGTISDTTPTFQWTAAKNATWYYLYVRNNQTGQVFSKWIKGATSYTDSKAFAEGNYTFWVRGWNNGKNGDWSKPMQFKIEIAKPGTPVLYGPGGTTNDTTPTFQWSAAKNATWYYLYVRSNQTGQVFTKWVQGATSYTDSKAFAEGSYTFWVRGWGNGKNGDWSSPKSFTIDTTPKAVYGVYVANGYVFVGTKEHILSRRCVSTPGWGLTGTVGEKIGGEKGLTLLSPRSYANGKDATVWLWNNITETKRIPLVAAPLKGKIGGVWYNITTAPGRP